MSDSNYYVVMGDNAAIPRGTAIPKQLELDRIHTVRALRNREEDHHA